MKTHLLNLLEHTPGCIWSASHRFDYVVLSSRADEMFGLPAKQIQGSKLWSWLPSEEQRNTNIHLLQVAIEQGKPDLELTYSLDSGETKRWLSENIHLHYCLEKNGGASQLVSVFGISFDITERKAQEKSTLQMKQQANKMEAIGTLVGGIAHEFNNMLAGVAGNVFLLKTEFEEGSKAAERLGRIDNLTRRASDLVRQMLAFSRQKATTIQHLELKPLIEKVCAIESAGLAPNIHLSVNIPDNTLISADPSQLIQVLSSLISNAADALGDNDSGEIRIDAEDAHNDETLSSRFPRFEHADVICLRVTDNGSGIPKDIQNRIFDPFFTTKDVGQGTGMGLSMAYGVMESLGGGIEVESLEKAGTCVRLYLLCSKPEIESSDITYGHHETVLVVDDEPLVSDAAMEMLEKISYQPVAVSNGHAAVEFISNHPDAVALILLDLVMPGMDGWETASRLRALNPELPIVFVTGYNLGDKKMDGIQISRSHIIAKPYTVTHLSQAIADLLAPESPPKA